MSDNYGLVIGPDNEPYEAVAFAEKYGLNIRAAELLLLANGTSRAKCDAAAMAFLAAVAAYARRQSVH
ncbi:MULTISPECIES: hypothetical protein [unclassified Mesorhizobium]|uniref:hypothetical protein n=1 Tax=unclassified Mesorhizobium TaxID=325217 RepID=UPI000FDBEED3|nr:MULTISPECIES: hypothetical protein [unclassified Mesorhizobium]TGQ34609.1 hypothetical protein EN859_024490 [Mesorhizobium sp. M00.F.Ca.ET.216.01.1.1]TIS54232.1 MAG: hypothetical protein E5W91_27765 [Mesorhizobium sp.]TIS88568.1 MAG: hypothetical protein E5W89_19560 [Mesorhizobium sp.]TJW09312.1 MAG: hypothetical protein E5W82_21450 [Mesorhizobium sp.]TJW33687.1 MAG: hypothetical protein E5W83_35820 [Mesorhizobium sp.]